MSSAIFDSMFKDMVQSPPKQVAVDIPKHTQNPSEIASNLEINHYELAVTSHEQQTQLTRTQFNPLATIKIIHEPKAIVVGQTLPAPDVEAFIALYFRLADKMAYMLSTGDIYQADSPHNKAIWQDKLLSVVGLDNKFVFDYDILFHRFIAKNVLDFIRNSYKTKYITPDEVTISHLANAYQPTQISSLAQAKTFMQTSLWTIVSSVCNNLFYERRRDIAQIWLNHCHQLLNPAKASNHMPSHLQEANANFDYFKKHFPDVVLNIYKIRNQRINEDSALEKNFKSRTGCVVFFEIDRFLDKKDIGAGQVDFELRYLTSTAYFSLLSGMLSNDYYDQFYYINQSALLRELSDSIDINEFSAMHEAFTNAVLYQHRHYYSPDWLD